MKRHWKSAFLWKVLLINFIPVLNSVIVVAMIKLWLLLFLIILKYHKESEFLALFFLSIFLIASASKNQNVKCFEPVEKSVYSTN